MPTPTSIGPMIGGLRMPPHERKLLYKLFMTISADMDTLANGLISTMQTANSLNVIVAQQAEQIAALQAKVASQSSSTGTTGGTTGTGSTGSTGSTGTTTTQPPILSINLGLGIKP